MSSNGSGRSSSTDSPFGAIADDGVAAAFASSSDTSADGPSVDSGVGTAVRGGAALMGDTGVVGDVGAVAGIAAAHAATSASILANHSLSSDSTVDRLSSSSMSFTCAATPPTDGVHCSGASFVSVSGLHAQTSSPACITWIHSVSSPANSVASLFGQIHASMR